MVAPRTAGVALAVCVRPAHADPQQQTERPTYKLELKPWDKLPNGKIVFVKGESNPEAGPGKPRVLEKLRTQGEVRMIVKADGPPKHLERLRCTYSAYSRYVKAAISFGDTASGIHAVTGLAWQNARAGILAEFSDWFDRYGFIYYTFMSDRYKRND